MTFLPQSTEMYNLHADYAKSLLTLADSIAQVKNIRYFFYLMVICRFVKSS